MNSTATVPPPETPLTRQLTPTRPGGTMQKRKLKIWKSTFCDGESLEGLIDKLEIAGQLSPGVGYAIGRHKTAVVKPAQLIQLVRLPLSEIGFETSALTEEIQDEELLLEWSRENLDGQILKLCPVEIGARLRDEYQDQPSGSSWIASICTPNYKSEPCLYGLTNHLKGLRLGMIRVTDHLHWPNDTEFIFQVIEDAPEAEEVLSPE